MKGRSLVIPVLLLLFTMLCAVHVADAEQYSLYGKPLNLAGYISQGATLSLNNKGYYDTARDVQSLLTNVFVEGDYSFRNNLRVYAAGMFTADWVYDVKSRNQEWNDQLFDKSRSNLYMDNDYWQVLKEAHVTWSPGDFNFRFGKQVVAWGETDGFRLMDQINPMDQSRGFSDVEFENTIIPIWLLKAEYYPKVETGWLQDMGFEFVFNPNISFIPNKTIQPGNDFSGIWAPNARIDNPFVPGGEIHLGSADTYDVDKPRSLSSKGFEYGFRVKGIVNDAIVTLNYFYGIDNSPTVWNMPIPNRIEMASDGKMLLHPNFQGRYDLLRFAGGTFSRDIPFLKSSALGGVAPVIRLEAFYLFGNTLAATDTTTRGMLHHTDEVRWALGVDWKIRVPFINPRSGITIMPQFYHRKILNYPNGKSLIEHDNQALLDPDNYMTTLMISTSYMNNKLTPSFFWMRDINRRADMFRYQVQYDYSDNWRYTVGALFLGGLDNMNNGVMNNSFEFYDHKDQLYLKVTYRWG
ncbi:MAG: hypothetical protein A4E64_02197 [Syntrophorhabdus sp. PtaU1.Bin058]|nr:MAG: hypothetical protein A4E64_02197 [Syntrophorhabdus sp. PtaU1.Bin058]